MGNIWSLRRDIFGQKRCLSKWNNKTIDLEFKRVYIADLLQLEIEEKLLSLSSTDLIGLGKGLQLDETNLGNKRKLELLKLIREAIDGDVEALEENDAKMKYLVEVKEQLKDEPPLLHANIGT